MSTELDSTIRKANGDGDHRKDHHLLTRSKSPLKIGDVLFLQTDGFLLLLQPRLVAFDILLCRSRISVSRGDDLLIRHFY